VICTGSLNYLYTKMTNYLNYLYKTKRSVQLQQVIGGRSLGTVGTWTKAMKSTRMISISISIKTHGSESRGQERAKRSPKNKTRDELLCASERFRHMTS